jgi:hypothetical protein
MRREYENNSDVILDRNRKYYQNNKNKIINQHKAYISNNESEIRQRRAEYYQNNKEAIREKHKQYMKSYFIRYPEKRYAHSARRRANKLLRSICEKDDYLDCTSEFFQKWIDYCIEVLEYSDMTIDNYGNYWQIDHVIPCSLWDLTRDDHRANCFHWSNLAPMYADKNQSKKNKIDMEQVSTQDELLELFANENNIDIYKITFPNDLAKPTIAGSS